MKSNILKLTSLMTGLILSLGIQPTFSWADDLDDAPEISIENTSTPKRRAMTVLERPPQQSATSTFQSAANSLDLDTAPEYKGTASSSHESTYGRGIYLRGSLGGSLKVKTKQNATGGSKIASRIGNAFSISGSVGYAFNDIFRVEGEVGYLGHMEFKNISGSPQKFDGTIFGVNAFADLGTIVGITPYVGLGIGGAKLKGADTRLRFNAQTGFAYNLNDKVALEFGYEYSKIMGGNLDINGTNYSQDNFDMHMFKLGTRIKF